MYLTNSFPENLALATAGTVGVAFLTKWASSKHVAITTALSFGVAAAIQITAGELRVIEKVSTVFCNITSLLNSEGIANEMGNIAKGIGDVMFLGARVFGPIGLLIPLLPLSLIACYLPSCSSRDFDNCMLSIASPITLPWNFTQSISERITKERLSFGTYLKICLVALPLLVAGVKVANL